MSEYKMAWEKWVDPFDNEESRVALRKLQRQETDEDDEDEDEDEENGGGIDTEEKVPVFIHPQLGIIPITDYSKPDRIFNFWTCHTNFDISRDIAKIVEETPGVEAFDPISRYRFRIGVAKLFQDRVVFDKITSNIKKRKKLDLTAVVEEPKVEPNQEDEGDETLNP